MVSARHRCSNANQHYRTDYRPEIIVAKEAIVLSLFDSDIDGSGSWLALQKKSDADGIVGGWWVNMVDDEQNLHQQPQRPASPTHLRQLLSLDSTRNYSSACIEYAYEAACH